MKIRIEKKSFERWEVEVALEKGKKPVVIQMDRQKIDLLMAMLETSKRAEVFKFEWEV